MMNHESDFIDDNLDFQTWICPRCCDDHHFSVACKATVVETFKPCEQDHSHIANEYRARIKELETERAKVAKLKAALEFYADGFNWSHLKPDSVDYLAITESDAGDGSFMLSFSIDDEYVGGKRAREALAELEQGE